MRVKKIDDEEEGTELTEDEIMGLSQGFHVILVHIHVIILAHVHIIILVHVHIIILVHVHIIILVHVHIIMLVHVHIIILVHVHIIILMYISSCTRHMTHVYKYVCTCIYLFRG